MKILATGATGRFAGLVVPALVRAGLHVRAVAHDAAKADIPRERGAQETVLQHASRSVEDYATELVSAS